MEEFLSRGYQGPDHVITSKDKDKLSRRYVIPFEACIPVIGMCFNSPAKSDYVLRLVAVFHSTLFFVSHLKSKEQTYTRVFGQM